MNNADVTVRNVSIAIGILILLPLAVNVGIDIVNPQHKIFREMVLIKGQGSV